MGHPTIYPTGATLYDPSRAWSGQVLGSWVQQRDQGGCGGV